MYGYNMYNLRSYLFLKCLALYVNIKPILLGAVFLKAFIFLSSFARAKMLAHQICNIAIIRKTNSPPGVFLMKFYHCLMDWQ